MLWPANTTPSPSGVYAETVLLGTEPPLARFAGSERI